MQAISGTDIGDRIVSVGKTLHWNFIAQMAKPGHRWRSLGTNETGQKQKFDVAEFAKNFDFVRTAG